MPNQQDERAVTSAPPSTTAEKPKLELGWVLAGRFEAVDREAAEAARARVLAYLRERFPAYDWRMPLVRRPEAVEHVPAEPTALLDAGVLERDARRWDFVFVVTQAPLRTYYKPFAFGAPSQAVQGAVLSTARIDPLTALAEDEQGSAARDERIRVIGRRLTVLAFHLFGHLGGLEHAEDPEDLMYDLRTVADLDAMRAFSEESRARLAEALADAADVRLEETGRYRGHTARFYGRALWIGRREIGGAVWRARPWEFPFRFSRLTAAAASTLVILVITAEAWDLGMSQPPGRVVFLTFLALAGTSTYVLKRQQLLRRRSAGRLSEQRVVANVSIGATVVLGMATTYVLLFALTLLLTTTLFSERLAAGWAASVEEIGPGSYFVLAGFVAALGVLIGALGASFEEQRYFRHVAYIDEET